MVKSRVSDAIRDYQQAEGADPVESPEIIEHPIDDKLQTGESRGMGGAMEIKSPW